MGEFFQGWRRKAGVMTLATSLAVVGIWARSTVKSDIIGIGLSRSERDVFISKNEWLYWVSKVPDTYRESSDWEYMRLAPDASQDEQSLHLYLLFAYALEQPRPIEPLQGCAMPVVSDGKMVVWRIPYWLVAMSQTLISAYLLLVKPRVAKLKVVIENRL